MRQATASPGLELRGKRKSQLWGYILLASAFVACPCHLPVTLGLLAGTAVGSFLADNLIWVVAAGTIYFVAALLAGLARIKEW